MVKPEPGSKSEGPHYMSLRDDVAARMARGELRFGDRLPSERDLQVALGMARGTVRQGLFQLEAEGVIYRRDRSGWYVSPPPVVYDPTRWEGFMAYVEAQARRPSTEVISVETIAADPPLAQVFARPVGASLYRLHRRRHVDERAVLVERIVVDAAMAPDLLRFPLDQSLTSILKSHYGLSVARNQVRMQPCALTGYEAEALGVKSGLPGLAVQRTSFDARGRVVEFDQEYWRHDAVRISVDIQVS
ncbi:GntR family transcriptional regulator [Brevundimonas sp. LM2]|uniref:UTRA domain-containing protein n=1 Tax=Brevundimonas sp. LM2 TaxID=1938605 RepID=UPI00098400B0|nr:UTRA domain-containing protein [Brevundimonas sp. LM2]AQR61310.1 GntR family transcriptional regulator [Brevundimonas sp. LM2]